MSLPPASAPRHRLHFAGVLPKALMAAGVLAVVGLAGYFVLTAPATWSAVHPNRDVANAASPNLVNGHALFYAGSCGTCHASPGQADETRLGGGDSLKSGFGTFYMPNISPDKADGIGGWSTAQFVAAMREGVSPHGANLYPAFPYTSFQRMTADDLRDLFGYIQTLAPVAGKARDNDLKFPFTMRRGVGLWKMVFLDGEPLVPDPAHTASWNRGRYLVEGVAHCAECHSPRNVAGAVVDSKRFSGAPDPEGNGYVPNITADDTGIGYWSQHEIATYLDNGISPTNIPAGGSMAAIIVNMSHLTPADREAMGEYLKSLKGIDSPNAGVPEPNRTATIRMLPPATNKAASPASVLATPVADLSNSATAYAVTTKPLFLDRPAEAADGQGDGRLLPAAKLTVVARQPGLLQVRVDGWQQEGSPSAIYALQGQRILMAALTPGAAAKVTRGKSVQDPATKITWYQVSLTAWTASSDLNPDIQKVWTYAGALYATSCGTCHSPHPADSYLANQWIGNLNAMKRFTALDDGQYRLLQAYLQFHSKDVGAHPAGKL
jgi:mono/diheme cytochrome c family protein